MAEFAVLVGLGSFLIAIIGIGRISRLEKQVDRLRTMQIKQNVQSPGAPKPTSKQPEGGSQSEAPTAAPPTTKGQADQAPAPDALEAVGSTQDGPADSTPTPASPPPPAPDPVTPKPQSEKRQTLHRLTSAGDDAPARPIPSPPATPRPTPKPQPKRVSLEERLGAGVYVWAGGIALMLAGAFLIKYSFDNDLLSLETRLCIVGGFGTVLVLASLWLRSRADKVAAAVCGAGVADLFATIMAATAYYHVLNPWWGFALMAVITAMAVAMSLMHGPFVALLGLVGGFAAPMLISGDLEQDQWWPIFTYLLLLEVGLAVITRKKQWFGLSALTLLAAIITTLAYSIFAYNPDQSHVLVLFVLATAVVFVINAAKAADAEDKAGGPALLRRIWLAIGSVGTGALLMTMLVGFSQFSLIELSGMGLLAAGALVLARLDFRYIAVSYLTAGLCGMMLLAWPAADQITSRVELNPTHYYLLAIGYGSMLLVGGFLCVWRNARPLMFVWLSASSALAFVVIPHIGCRDQLPEAIEWWMVYTAVVVIVVAFATMAWRTRPHHGTRLIDPYVITAAALATFAIWFAADRPWASQTWVATGWCGLAVFAAMLDRRLNLRWLMLPVCWLSGAALLLMLVPGPWHYGLPMRLGFNMMLLHYGLPALGFAAIALIYHRDPWVMLRVVFQSLALVVAVVAVTLQIRLGFHPDDLWREAPTLVEVSTHIGFWLGVGAAVTRFIKQPALIGLRNTAIGIGVVGMAVSVLGLLTFGNPFIHTADVGETIVGNWLLYIYGLPCVIALVFWRVLPNEVAPFKWAAGILSYVLLFALISLQIRHGFTQGDMKWRTNNPVILYEWATYSVVWLLMAIGITWAGRRWRAYPIDLAAVATGLAGMVAVLVGGLILDNPLETRVDVGATYVLNGLLYIYGLPCLLIAVWSSLCRDKMLPLKPIAASISLVLLFVLVSMQVRHGFAGADLRIGVHPISQAESYGYSLAWVLLALTLLVSGIVTGSTILRYGSLVIMLVAVGKVALDVAQLKDLWRVFSLLGLGLSLIVLGFIYQRFVFRRPKPTEAEPVHSQEVE